MVRISDIHDNKVNWQDVPYCKISQSEIGTYLLQENDILFARTGGTVGKSFLMGTVSEPAIYAGYLIRTRYSKELCPQYLKSFMESSLYWEQLRSGTIATAQPNCNGKTLGRMLLPIPPKIEQNRITSILQTIESSLDKYTLAQEALDKLNADIFDKLKKSVLQEAIQGRLVPQDPNDESASVLLERIKAEKAKLFTEGKLKKKDLVDSVIFKGEDNKYYETIDGVTECIDEEIPYDLPSNWAWTRLGNVAKMTIGKTPARGDQRFWSNGEYSWVSISDMKDLGVISVTKERISAIAVNELMGNISPKGSLLMSFKLTVGRTSLLEIDAYHNEAIITVLPFIDECNTFRNYLFRTLPLLSVAGDSKDAIKGKTLNSQSLSRLLIPLAPLGEQERIVQELQRATSLMN